MTELELRDLVSDWDLSKADENPRTASRFQALLQKLTWLGETQWSRYLPSEQAGEDPRYLSRLARWLGNVSGEQDRQQLLEYATHITFFSRDDFDALHLAAFRGPITRWVIEQSKLHLADPKFQERLADELRALTWYCPVTDSLDINEFCHLNHLTGIRHRPAFSPLATFGGPPNAGAGVIEGLRRYIEKPTRKKNARRLSRLVLLEDFVGSGEQSEAAVRWAVEKLGLPVLFVPLVICPNGSERFAKLEAMMSGKLTVRALVEISRKDLLGPARHQGANIANASEIEALARATFTRVSGGCGSKQKPSSLTPFGYQQTGCSYATYSNTPNNTLPMIHHRPPSGTWHPLFPRSSRE